MKKSKYHLLALEIIEKIRIDPNDPKLIEHISNLIKNSNKKIK